MPSLKIKYVIVMHMRENKAKHYFAQKQGYSCIGVTRLDNNERIQKLLNRHSLIQKSGYKKDFYVKAIWKVFCLNYFIIWALIILFCIEHILR